MLQLYSAKGAKPGVYIEESNSNKTVWN